jgi:AcrR family transcriptional regulator
MPKIIGGSLEEHREKMHERIFVALAQLLRDRGYDAVTLADVAAAAGLGRTAMYNYYADKESLLIGYTAHETGLYVSQLKSELAGEPNPVGQLRIFVRMQLNHLATQHMAPGSISSVLTEDGRKKMQEHIEPLWRTLREIIAEAVEQRYLPDEDVDLLLPLVTASIGGRSTADLSGERLRHAIETTTTYVLRGLGAKLTPEGEPRKLSLRK